MRICGSTNIPTDTKKIAPKRFLTGSTSRMILSASIVSAKILPITNAPKAALNPTCVDITAMRQHKPNDTTRRVSLLRSLRVERRKRGIAKSPITNHKTRKNPILAMLPRSCAPLRLVPLAIVLSITIITMARMSSRMRTLITVGTNPCCVSPISLSALYIMVVELIASIPPRKMQSISFHPKLYPTTIPKVVIERIMVLAAMMGDAPILSIFFMEKSKPNANNRKITPMSAHVCMFALSTTLIR